MATLYITECAEIGETLKGGRLVQAPAMPPIAEQHITISGSSTASAAFNAATSFVMVHTDAICSLAWSTNSTPPTAVTTAQRLAANETRFYVVVPGGTLAVISNT